MRRAVVLGSGGGIGRAWEIGILMGLRNAGADLTAPDLFVGSSAGAVLAVLLRSGQSLVDLFNALIAPASPMVVRPAERSSNQEARSAADIEYFADAMRLWSQAMVDTAVRVELGKRALATPHPISEDAQQANQRRRVAVDDWPDAALKIAAVDVADGHVRFFDRSQHVPFITALAATTAQPGLQAPITVDGHRYMDGGVAGTNLDGAVGYEIVVGITPFGARDKTSWEMEQVRAAGGRVLDITADDEARRAMGPITSGRTKDAAAAGLRQAAAMSSAVRELWLGQS